MFFLFSLLFVFIAGQPQYGQYPPLPRNNLTLPTLNKTFNVLITGGRYKSIALATALQYWQLGATVTITTRNLKTFNYSVIAGTDIKVMCLHLGLHCSKCNDPCRAYRFANLYRQTYLKNPDVYIAGALTVYNGDHIDYTSKELDFINRAYFTDPIEIERVFLENNNPGQQMKFLYISSWAGRVFPPWYQQIYNTYEGFLLQRLEGQNAALRFPNVEWLATLCVFTATDAMIFSQNPSATRAGLYSQQQFQTKFTQFVAAGNPPSFVATAIAQATLLRAQLNFETIFDASGVFSANIQTFVNARATLSGNQFTAFFRAVSLNGYTINISDQTPPAFLLRKPGIIPMGRQFDDE